MKVTIKKFPVDIVIFFLWSIILLPIVFLNIADILRITMGIPFLFFIPGYMLISLLFPTKPEYNGINGIQRVGLSIGFSIVIVSIIGLLFNYTPVGIRLEPILLSLFFITIFFGTIALFRWKTTDFYKRYIISLTLPLSISHNRSENILFVLVIFSIVIAVISIGNMIIMPKKGEIFTDFYILPQNKNASNFPQIIYKEANTSVILGLINHEYKTMNYTIEVWLIDESLVFNNLTKKNETIYNHAWFIDNINVRLDHTEITNEKNQINNWECNYTFTIDKIGYFKLTFLLFTSPSEDYDTTKDYKDSISQIMNNSYRNLHLWLYFV